MHLGKMELHNKHILTCRRRDRSLLALEVSCKHNARNRSSHLVTTKGENINTAWQGEETEVSFQSNPGNCLPLDILSEITDGFIVSAVLVRDRYFQEISVAGTAD